MQNIQDARMLGLSGAYSTLSSGYRAVGVNPANINNGTNWTVNIFSSKTSFLNNFFTLDRYNEINGAHFDNPLASSYYPKEEILNILNGEGLKFNSNSGDLSANLIGDVLNSDGLYLRANSGNMFLSTSIWTNESITTGTKSV